MLRGPLELAFRGGLPGAVIAGLMESAVGNDSFRVVQAAGRYSGRKPEYTEGQPPGQNGKAAGKEE